MEYDPGEEPDEDDESIWSDIVGVLVVAVLWLLTGLRALVKGRR